ncbi:MAG: GDYXXLXY domain-containing protein, partial [Armatimonadota bacterium]
MRTWFYTIIGLQILFLLGESGTAHMGLRTGQLVTLRVAPVDPRSLFMGRYMALSYDISTIDLSTVAHPEPIAAFDRGTTVYVGLTPRRPWAAPHTVTTRPPAGGSSTPYLRGRIRSYHGTVVRVEYGLERYFIPEAK